MLILVEWNGIIKSIDYRDKGVFVVVVVVVVVVAEHSFADCSERM